MSLIDIHGHYLPGVDDGSRSIEESLAMIRSMEELGFRQIICTPHRGESWPAQDSLEERRLVDLEEGLAREGSEVRLGLGGEYMLDGRFQEDLEGDRIRTLGEENQAFLIELMHSGDAPLYMEDVLFKARIKGYDPVLAHPERSLQLMSDWPRLEDLALRGTILLVSLGGLVGRWGGAVRQSARRMFREGLVRAMASDLHALEEVEKDVVPALEWIRREAGDGAVDLLLGQNVETLLEGVTSLDDLEPLF